MSKKYIIAVAIIGLLTFSAGLLFYFPKSLTPSSKKLFQPPVPYNVIIIGIDTLRADHLGMYGYSRDTSPNLDRFAEESILFEQAIAQASYTLPSQASFFTSQYPRVHGLLQATEVLADSRVTLAEVLKGQGYKTAAFVGDGHLSGQFGFAQGFDIYVDDVGRSFVSTIPLAVEWLKKNKAEKFLLFLHAYDAHPPFEVPVVNSFDHIFDPDYDGILHNEELIEFAYRTLPNQPPYFHAMRNILKIGGQAVMRLENETIIFEPQDIYHTIAHQDGRILHTDYLIQQFLDVLQDMGLYENSLVIIFSDHGLTTMDNMTRQVFSDKTRLVGHRGVVYDEVIRVPLLIKHPLLGQQKVNEQIQLIDIFPTILDILRIPIEKNVKKQLQGKSFLPLLTGRAGPNVSEYAYGEGDAMSGLDELQFIRTLQWKLIVKAGERFELYNLKDDPKETQNVISQHPDVAAKLKQKFEEWEFTNLKKRSQLE